VREREREKTRKTRGDCASYDTGTALGNNNNNNIFIYLLQLCFYPVVVFIVNVNRTRNWLLLNLSPEGYMRSM